jgi:inner membrane protein
MTGRTHDLAAITALGAAVMIWPLHPLTLSSVLIGILANQLGGIAPDIDEPTAPLWRNLPIGGIFGKITGKLLGGHRFLTHSLLGAALFGTLVYELLKFLTPIISGVDQKLVLYAFMIGFVSHLFMDTLTKEGVPWVLPIPVKFGIPPLRAWRITTGKAIEVMIIFPGLVIADILYGAYHYNRLISFVHLLIR